MSQSIQVSFVQEGDVYTVHTGSSVLKDIVMDYTGVPETERGGGGNSAFPHRGGRFPCPERFRRLRYRGPGPEYRWIGRSGDCA